MKKETGIGIGIAIVVFVIIFGIISLPDEVLIESPSVDTSTVQIGEEKKIVVPSESISSTEQSEPDVQTPVEQSEPDVQTPVEQSEPDVQTQVEQSEPEVNTQGNVIKIKIKDGVGTGDR